MQSHKFGPLDVTTSVGAAVGEALRRRRAQAGLSQEELALRANVSPRFIRRVEEGMPNHEDKVVTLLRCLAACQTVGGA